MFEKAREFYQKCNMPATFPDLAVLLNNISLIQMEMNRFDQALQNLQNCIHMQERTLPSTDHPSIARTCYNLSGCFIALHRLNDAEKYANRAANIARLHSDPELKEYTNLINTIQLSKSNASNTMDIQGGKSETSVLPEYDGSTWEYDGSTMGIQREYM